MLDRSVVPEVLTAVIVEIGTAVDTGPKTESARWKRKQTGRHQLLLGMLHCPEPILVGFR